jgi:predicted nucleic-acid-binding protein
MDAADTNVIVRYLVRDHPEQTSRAAALIDGGAVWVGLTVVLETEWVLRGAYGYPAKAIIAALRTLFGQPTITVENPAVAAQAFALCDGGMDLADALHVSAAGAADSFCTFDAGLVKRAARAGVAQVRVL